MKDLHIIVRSQFPEFVRADYPLFLEFVQAYYKWLETEYNLDDIKDIVSLETAPEQFVEYFRKELDPLNLFKSTVPFNRTYLQKIKQIYAAKGSEQALVNILRITHNAAATVTYPVDNVLKASDGVWQQNRFITVKKLTGNLPTNDVSLYLQYQYNEIPLDIVKFQDLGVNQDGDEFTRFFFRTFVKLNINVRQIISIETNVGGVSQVVYTGEIVESSGDLEVIASGENWQVGQVIQIPNDERDTILRVTSVGANGAIKALEVIQYGYPLQSYLNTGSRLVVSQYPEIPLSTADSSWEWLNYYSGTKSYTLTVSDYIQTSDEVSGTTTTELSEVITSIDVSTLRVSKLGYPRPDIGAEQWVDSRCVLEWKGATVVVTPGAWKTEAGQISHQNIRLQDNWYYQQFSYDVKSTINPNEYISVAQSLHPAGTKMFSTYVLSASVGLTNSTGSTSIPFIALNLSEYVTVGDSVAFVQNVIRNVSDTVEIQDTKDITATGQIIKQYADTVIVDDSLLITHVPVVPPIELNISDTVVVSSPSMVVQTSAWGSVDYFSEDYQEVGYTLTNN